MRHGSTTLPQAVFAAMRNGVESYLHPEAGTGCTTIASYNVHKCVGIDGKFDPARTANVIGELDADIVALQEADARFGRKEGLLDLAFLKSELGLAPVDLKAHAPSHGWHGNVILARGGVVRQVRRLTLPGLEPRGALVVDLELKGVPLRIVAAHLGLLRRSRLRQAHALIEATQTALSPVILLGDLNEWRVRSRSPLLQLAPQFGPVHATLPSYPSRFPLLALDRILASPHHLIASIDVHNTPIARVASDHLPIKARINLKAQFDRSRAAGEAA